MNGKQKLLVAGDYGASDESDTEDAQPVNEPSKSDSRITNNSNKPQDTNIAQGRFAIWTFKISSSHIDICWGLKSIIIIFNYHFMYIAWSVLYDQVSGYPYYWNPTTNEVRWDKPLELEQKQQTNQRQALESNSSAKVRSVNILTAE